MFKTLIFNMLLKVFILLSSFDFINLKLIKLIFIILRLNIYMQISCQTVFFYGKIKIKIVKIYKILIS